MSNTKFKSLDAIKASIRAGRKYAMELNPPEDPNVKAKEEPPVVTEEKTVSIKEAAANVKNALTDILNKAASKQDEVAKEESKKEASVDNVASNVDLSPVTLSKIATAMLATEEGRRAALNSLEQYKAEQMKQASLKELLVANELYNQHKTLAKTASENYTKDMNKIASAHQEVINKIEKDFANDPEFAMAVKRAYAQGAADTAQIQGGGADPAAAAASTEAAQDDVMAVINELVQSGQIDEQGAQALAEMAAQAAAQDGNPELSPEEAMMLLQQAVEAGIIPAETAQQIMGGAAAGGEEAPAPEQGAPAEAPAAPAPEAQKTASVHNLAAQIIDLTFAMKKQAAAEGAVEDAEASIDDVDAVVDELVSAGQISPEDGEAVKGAIVEGLAAEDGGDVDASVEHEPIEGGDDEDLSVEELGAALEELGVTEDELVAALQDAEGEEGEEEEKDLGEGNEAPVA